MFLPCPNFHKVLLEKMFFSNPSLASKDCGGNESRVAGGGA